MKSLAIVTLTVIFSLILFVEIGWIAFIILPVFVFFMLASLIPMMVDDADDTFNSNLPVYNQ